MELLLEDFLGQSAESLYCVYGLSMAPIDTDMFDSTACDWWELVESRGRRPSPYNTGEGALMVQLGDKVTCAGFGVLVLSKEKISVTTMKEQGYVTREFTFPDWVTAKAEDGTPTLNTLERKFMRQR